MMSALDLRSGYLQLAVNPSDIVKTAFATKNGTYAIRRMPLACQRRLPIFRRHRYLSQTRVIVKFEGIRRGQVGRNESASFKIAGFQKPFELFTDASSIGVGAVLNQEQRPVVFASRMLSNAERNYTVTERECLAVVWTLNNFRTYLGSLPIKVITDHAALTRLTNGKNLSSRMIRWVLKLAEFNIKWEYRFGTQNAVADVLSRNPVESIIGEKINCAIIRDLVLSL
ncbi:retrovirus-related Pol polyprotein from transposon gypsy [Trichonephila clavipes]|nr:retrovirus-related Pol polyprotein from transposon gypsy [Trichonephila clavipes]